MPLCHEFVQITPDAAREMLNNGHWVGYEYVRCHPADVEMIVLDDELVQRNIGRTDGRKTDDWSGMSIYEPGKMRYFSAFIAQTDGYAEHAGLAYYGITLLNEGCLQALAAPLEQSGSIHPQDRYALSRFRRFCEQTLHAGLWLVHFGI